MIKMKKTLLALSLASALVAGTAMAAPSMDNNAPQLTGRDVISSHAYDLGFTDKSDALNFAKKFHVSQSSIHTDGSNADVVITKLSSNDKKEFEATTLKSLNVTDVGFKKQTDARTFAEKNNLSPEHQGPDAGFDVSIQGKE